MNDYYLDKINPFLHSILPFTKEIKKILLAPEQLLSPNRFDVAIKYSYLKYMNLGVNVNWAKQMYIDHISAFSNGKFCEGDFSGKGSIDKYLAVFDAIANSIRQHGFNEKDSLLPLSSEKVIIDGSHRLAACLYYKCNVPCLLFKVKTPNYNFQYFKNRGMKSKWLDLAAIEYTRLNANTYVLTVFPVASGKDIEIDSIIGHYGRIYYQKNIYLNKTGALNLIRQLYYGEPWAGDFKKGFSGEKRKVEQCFRENIPLKAYFFESDSPDKVKECKEEIRALFNYGNNSAHATDDHDETVRIAEQLLNDNSIHFLNSSTYTYSKKLENLLLAYRKWLDENSYDKEFFCIDSSAVLNIYGIREARDLDFLHFGCDNLKISPEDISSHQAELIHYSISPEEIIFNPANHFYYNGLKFTTLNVLMRMKFKRNELKDKRDVILIKKIMSNSFSFRYTLFSIRYKILQELRYFPERVKYMVLKTAPSGILPYLKVIYRVLKKIKTLNYVLCEYLGPYEKTRRYKGFVLACTRGYSLVSRITDNSVYEPELSRAIINELKKTQSEYFLDVGANIGIVSLNVLSELPDIKIFCIETGFKQTRRLKTTISINNLTDKMQIFQCALEEGKEYRLDNWWRSAGSCSIKVVKIDTKGAELLILRGGEEFIRQCRPVIFLEINKRNIKAYPYREVDLLEWLDKTQYILKTLDGNRVVENNLDYYLNETDSYVAVPN